MHARYAPYTRHNVIMQCFSQSVSEPEYVSQGWERLCLAVTRCLGSKSSMGSKKSSRRAACGLDA